MAQHIAEGAQRQVPGRPSHRPGSTSSAPGIPAAEPGRRDVLARSGHSACTTCSRCRRCSGASASSLTSERGVRSRHAAAVTGTPPTVTSNPPRRAMRSADGGGPGIPLEASHSLSTRREASADARMWDRHRAGWRGTSRRLGAGSAVCLSAGAMARSARCHRALTAFAVSANNRRAWARGDPAPSAVSRPLGRRVGLRGGARRQGGQDEV